MTEWQYFAIPALSVVVLLLFLALLLAVLIFLRKRELLCFKSRRRKRTRRDEETNFTNIYSKDKKPTGLKRRRQHNNYADPFATRFSDPLFMDQGLENFDISQWDNPLFDAKGAREREAAITIQTWWRMVR